MGVLLATSSLQSRPENIQPGKSHRKKKTTKKDTSHQNSRKRHAKETKCEVYYYSKVNASPTIDLRLTRKPLVFLNKLNGLAIAQKNYLTSFTLSDYHELRKHKQYIEFT